MDRLLPAPPVGASAALARLAFVIDLDGTLVRGRRPVPGAAALIRRLGDRFAIVSNNSTHSVPGLAAELAAAGLEIAADRLILAGVAAVRLVAREHAGARVLLIGSAGLRREAERAGLVLVDDRADLVLLARDEAFTYDKLARAANEVRRGAALVAANPDGAHPGADDLLVPETGALLQAVVACAGPTAVRIVGKPQPDLFQHALRRLGAAPGDIIVIGDNPETDGAGAARAGMRHLLVGPGPGCHLRDLEQLVAWLPGA